MLYPLEALSPFPKSLSSCKWEAFIDFACGVSAHYWKRILCCECPLLNVHPVAWVLILERACGMSAHYWTCILWRECLLLNAHLVTWLRESPFVNTHIVAWAHYWTRILWCECPLLNVHVAWGPFFNAHLVAGCVIYECASPSMARMTPLCGMSDTSLCHEQCFLVSWVTPLCVMSPASLCHEWRLFCGSNNTSLWHERHFFVAWATLLCGMTSTL